MRVILFLVLSVLTFSVSAQSFLKNPSRKPLTFKEIQQQFSTFKKTHDLKKEKGWKNYKRWEYDMQMHTDAQGEPAGFDEYITAAIEVAEAKQAQERSSSMPSVWAPFGPNVLPNNLTGYMENGIGRINCTAFHPTNPNTYFVGVAQGGVWKTTNNGASWTPLTDNLPITRISDISINPTNPNEMYISVCDFEYIGFGLFINGRKRHTHYGLGVYKTTDGGNTWTATGLTFQLTNGDASLIRKVLIHPTNTNSLVACGSDGLWTSANGGTTWTKKLDSLCWDLQRDPVNPNILYMATGWVMNSNLGTAAVYKSTNFGQTWTVLNTGIPLTGAVQRIKLAVAPSDPNYIYAACVDVNFGLYGIYKSTDAGANWTFIPPTLNILEWDQGFNLGGQGTYDFGFIVHPTDKDIVYSGGINLWGSTDGANNFDPISHWTLNNGPTLHGDIHSINYNPASGQYFVTSDGGAYRTSTLVTSDWTTTAWPTVWTNLNSGLQVTSFYRLSSSKTLQERVVAGAQDNASFYYKGGTWSTIFGGDGMDNYIDPQAPTDVFGSAQYGYFYYSNDDGNTNFGLSSNPNSEQSEWLTPIAADYAHPGVLYIGNENVVQSTDGGGTWNPLASIYTNTTSSTNTEISALAVSPSNSLVVYAARRVRYEVPLPGMVFKTTDGGASFTNITSNLPDSLYYTGLEVDEANPNIAYVCMAGFSSGRKVYMTNNGGTSWTNITFNLPNIPVNCIKQLPATKTMMVATDLGIYTLAFGSSAWVNNSTGLPNVIISDIEFNVPLNKIYISTFGRGIWQTSYNVFTNIAKPEKVTFSFKLFPSINDGKFTLQFDNAAERKLEVIDVMGKTVHTGSSKQDQIQMNLNLLPGAYYLRVVSADEKLSVQKFVVK
jgi:photosystem II stability/assembly factor-like uncharacterized protein